MAPTGKAAKVTGIWVHRLADGKIVESWNVWDTQACCNNSESFLHWGKPPAKFRSVCVLIHRCAVYQGTAGRDTA
jgi:hypothetical protein